MMFESMFWMVKEMMMKFTRCFLYKYNMRGLRRKFSLDSRCCEAAFEILRGVEI